MQRSSLVLPYTAVYTQLHMKHSQNTHARKQTSCGNLQTDLVVKGTGSNHQNKNQSTIYHGILNTIANYSERKYEKTILNLKSSTLKKKSPGRNSIALRLSEATWQECELFGNTYCRGMGRGLRRLLTYLLTLTSTVNMDTEHLICVVECYRTQPMITNTLRTTCRRKTQFERGYGSTQTVQTAICCYAVQVIPYTFSSSD
ncbi:hypothetical protein ANN_13504 [Periplaneta americana]|uniref:Uncharacterized protein n=1 Tax=Periplaneta americana TaxID=6978 RepID=A0ABQ8TLK8_PERAM|nr:hypothetical protein ANN_13504 [Periplaneta americana]